MFATCVVVLVLCWRWKLPADLCPIILCRRRCRLERGQESVLFPLPHPYVAVTWYGLRSRRSRDGHRRAGRVGYGIFPRVRPFLQGDRGYRHRHTGAVMDVDCSLLVQESGSPRIFFILLVILLPFYALNVYEGVRALPKSSRHYPELPSVALADPPVSHPAAYRGLYFSHDEIGDWLCDPYGDFRRAGSVRCRRWGADESGQSHFGIDQVLAWTFFLVILNPPSGASERPGKDLAEMACGGLDSMTEENLIAAPRRQQDFGAYLAVDDLQ